MPEEQRGTVSGVIAVCLPVGQALGTLVVLLLVWLAPERPVVAANSPGAGGGSRAGLRALWIDPRAHPDFAWACLSRFLRA